MLLPSCFIPAQTQPAMRAQPSAPAVVRPRCRGWRWPRCPAALLNASEAPATRLPWVRFQGEDLEHTASKRMRGEGKRWLSGERFNHIKRVIAPTETFALCSFDPFFIHISFHFSAFVETRWGNQ